MNIWSGELSLALSNPSSNPIKDINLLLPDSSLPREAGVGALRNAKLQYLSGIDVSRVPLYLIVGPSLHVWTEDKGTEDWFDHQFSSCWELASVSEEKDEPWWGGRLDQCPVGLLAQVIRDKDETQHDGVEAEQNDRETDDGRARITEVLFYCCSTRPVLPRVVRVGDARAAFRQSLRVYALLLSSDLVHQPRHRPLSLEDDTFQPRFIESPLLAPDARVESIAEDTRKHNRVTDVFDEAEQRRKRAKRKGGESVAQAASGGQNGSVGGGARSRSSSNRPGHNIESPKPQETLIAVSLALSVSPGLPSESWSARRRSTVNGHTRSSLSYAESINVNELGELGSASTETRNKEALSRVVMAGMRLYGLELPKKDSKHHRDSGAPDLSVTYDTVQDAAGITQQQADVGESQADNKDEEYKRIYHQTFKSAAFALRNDMSRALINADTLRDTVEKLLAIFCFANPMLTTADDSFATTHKSNGVNTEIAHGREDPQIEDS